MRSPTALLALALLLGAARAASPGNGSTCSLLASLSADRVARLGQRGVSHGGQEARVVLVWGSAPAHAAAALLHALLRHVWRYRGVTLPRAPHPHSIAALARNVTHKSSGAYTNLVIGVSTAWEHEPPPPWMPNQGRRSGLAGPRLSEFGASSVPARCRLFAWLPERARARPDCHQHARWSFYANQSALAHCDFVDVANRSVIVTDRQMADVVAVDTCNSILGLLEERANASKSPLRGRVRANRTEFMRMLQTANRSFLFLDYDMWKEVPGVSVVEPPPCVTVDFDCKQELDSAIAMRVADVNILEAYAPQLFQFVHDFRPSLKSLRWVLERQARGVDIEEAACEWVLENKSYNISSEDRTKYDLHKYTVATYLCTGDPNNWLYDKIISLIGKPIHIETSKVGCDIQLPRYFINCSDQYHMSHRLDEYTRTAGIYKLVGMVSMAVKGAEVASPMAAASHVPLMLADVVPEPGAAERGAAWRVAGRPRHLARALRHFVLAAGWTRVAVLSQPTKLATDYNDALNHDEGIILGNFPIPSQLTEQQAQEVLQELRDSNARIVFVNADTQAAIAILNAAVASHMRYADGYVWIVREWRQTNVVCGTKHFTVSFWARGDEDIPPAEGWQPLRERLRKYLPRSRPWPPRAFALADALLTLSFGFKDVFQRVSTLRHDLHNAQMIQSLEESLINTPVTGISQRLRFKERSIEETFVFVDQWCGSKFEERLATWRVNASSGAVRGARGERASYSLPAELPRDDGASRCAVRSGDAFRPRCHDAECACALLLLALAPGAALLARRALRRRLARLRHEQQIQVIARRQHVAAVLAAYLVQRADLELHEELGAGRFGKVRLARLRGPTRAPRYIAAKALRDNAAASEESEFLREACTIASLDHPHIVRLVGVCIADGPPLVLMELAFFGDLLGYLRARRHLVEGSDSEAPEPSGELEHVSALALTRLAREAAEALQYLGVRGVVHRDVRAANCLVDVRRSLKLADFGMARDTVAGADGAPEYACRRRGLFPVLWMAPESLAHGVFSAASDVWALGVLVLELVTLGARPYGTMSPLRVLEYVTAGGSPPLPLDATPQTRGLTRLCWARAAEGRPSAAEVAAYLAARPLALGAALLTERDEPADADSGFGESPSTELLPPDSPLDSLAQLEDFATTH